eukprot:254690-Rhodomonas_salina.2
MRISDWRLGGYEDGLGHGASIESQSDNFDCGKLGALGDVVLHIPLVRSAATLEGVCGVVPNHKIVLDRRGRLQRGVVWRMEELGGVAGFRVLCLDSLHHPRGGITNVRVQPLFELFQLPEATNDDLASLRGLGPGGDLGVAVLVRNLHVVRLEVPDAGYHLLNEGRVRLGEHRLHQRAQLLVGQFDQPAEEVWRHQSVHAKAGAPPALLPRLLTDQLLRHDLVQFRVLQRRLHPVLFHLPLQRPERRLGCLCVFRCASTAGAAQCRDHAPAPRLPAAVHHLRLSLALPGDAHLGQRLGDVSCSLGDLAQPVPLAEAGFVVRRRAVLAPDARQPRVVWASKGIAADLVKETKPHGLGGGKGDGTRHEHRLQLALGASDGVPMCLRKGTEALKKAWESELLGCLRTRKLLEGEAQLLL